MLPNRFPDAGEQPEYNTVDATLWYFEAVRALLKHTGDYQFVQTNLYGVLADIIVWHEQGTRYGIRVDEDGLLYSGEPGVQLTWMDAKVGDWVVTPRHGKAVEVQALWYNALCILADLEKRAGRGDESASLTARAKRVKERFVETFWNAEASCLFDVVDGDRKDASIRPNQIFAISLPHASHPTIPPTAAVTKAIRRLETPRTTRAPSGRGFSVPMPTRSSKRTERSASRRRARRSKGSRRTCSSPASGRSPRSSTVMRHTPRAAARHRLGASARPCAWSKTPWSPSGSALTRS
jgi:hypothetical protein